MVYLQQPSDRHKYQVTNETPKFGDPFPQGVSNSWFPAYHLARTALGAICVDPGWNYLIEIGLSITELEGFKGCKRLVNQLTKSPGTQHHICLASELFYRGLLVDLEPLTGDGSATNDLLVKVADNCYAIEVKEFTSNKPKFKIIKELKDKEKKLPKNPNNPVLFHVVLREVGYLDCKKEQEFIDDICSNNLDIPPRIGAVIIGTRFIDSNGGRVKRETKKIIINDKSIHPINISEIEHIFKNNYSEVCQPSYGIGTFFCFENRKST